MKGKIIFTVILFFILQIFTRNPVYSGMKAENFPVFSINGERFVFYKLVDAMPDKGLIIVNFTSVDCRPCKKEIPELKSIAESGGERLKLMCLYTETADQAKPNAESLGVSDNAFVDPFGNIQKLYRVKKYPVTFVIDKHYSILGRFDGYTPANIKKIRKLCGL